MTQQTKLHLEDQGQDFLWFLVDGDVIARNTCYPPVTRQQMADAFLEAEREIRS